MSHRHESSEQVDYENESSQILLDFRYFLKMG